MHKPCISMHHMMSDIGCRLPSTDGQEKASTWLEPNPLHSLIDWVESPHLALDFTDLIDLVIPVM